MKQCATYESVINVHRYSKKDGKRSKKMTYRYSTSFTLELADSPDDAAVERFCKFVDWLIFLQKQLCHVYHEHKFAKDRLMTTIDIPVVQIALWNRIPCTDHQITNRVSRRLSEIAKSDGLSFMNYKPFVVQQQTDNAICTLGQGYSGAVRCFTNLYLSKRQKKLI